MADLPAPLPLPAPGRVLRRWLVQRQTDIAFCILLLAAGVAHGGKPNRGADRRIGFNVTYITPAVRSVRPEGAFAQLIRGVDAHQNFVMDVHPTLPEPTEAERAAHKEKARGLSKTVMAGADVERFKEVSVERQGLNVAPHVARDSSAYAEFLDDDGAAEERHGDKAKL